MFGVQTAKAKGNVLFDKLVSELTTDQFIGLMYK